jgi:hypothetical protein
MRTPKWADSSRSSSVTTRSRMCGISSKVCTVLNRGALTAWSLSLRCASLSEEGA